jgi:hypothetical protein
MSTMTKNRAHWSSLAFLAGFLFACDDAQIAIDAEPEGEGVAYDAQHPGADLEGLGKADHTPTYEIPLDLPELERPEIIVSLATNTVHLFDRATGFSAIYPTGPGRLGNSGRSITPKGFFKTGPDTSDSWYYIARRYLPDYFGGFPFLRLNTRNSQGHHTYGLHGPITYTCPDDRSSCPLTERQWFLVHDYVSAGCLRMEADDIVDLFWMVRNHPSTPVTIFDGVELDAVGQVVDLGSAPVLWAEGESIAYAECGLRDDPWSTTSRWPSDRC